MNELQVFKNEEFGSVRAVEINGEPWFVGRDVADALGYSNSKDALSCHVDADDKQVIQRSENATFEIPNRGLTIINESGLYGLIMGSKLPNAKQFKHWVTSEVLPSIRKHGAYMTAPTIDAIIADPDYGIRLLTELKDEQDRRKALETELDRSKEWYSIKRVAAINGMDWHTFKWKKLKDESIRAGLGVKKIFDANYGEVNTYHMSVWEKVYPWAEL